jgi:hypothetical protein
MRPGYMDKTKKAQEAMRQKKLRDTPVPVKSGKTTAAQYKAAYGVVPGETQQQTKLKAINKRGYMVSKKRAAEGVSKLMSTQSASVIPDDETAKSITTIRQKQKGTTKKTAVTNKSTPDTTNKSTPDTTNKGPSVTSTTSATKKKRKKHTKRAARERFREAVVEKNKTPGRTKKTIEGIKEFVGKAAGKFSGNKNKKTTKQEELEAAYGSPKDTKRMMKGKPLKESRGSKLRRGKKKKQKEAHDKKVKAMGGIPKIQM